MAAALRALGGRTSAELEAEREAGARAKAARAKLTKTVAAMLGEHLLATCRRAGPFASMAEAQEAAVASLRIIDEGADLDCTDAVPGFTPLMWASTREELDAFASRLVAAGAKLDLVGVHGVSALMTACMYKRAATAMLLIEAGAELNLVDSGGNTALDFAVREGLTSVAAAIRARGGATRAELASRA